MCLPEKVWRGGAAASELNRRHLDFTSLVLFLGLFVCCHLYPLLFTCAQASLKQERNLRASWLEPPSVQQSFIGMSWMNPFQLSQDLLGSLHLPTSLLGTWWWRGAGTGEGARGSACGRVSVASEPGTAPNFITGNNLSNLVRFLGHVNDMLAWHLTHGKLSINIGNY